MFCDVGTVVIEMISVVDNQGNYLKRTQKIRLRVNKQLFRCQAYLEGSLDVVMFRHSFHVTINLIAWWSSCYTVVSHVILRARRASVKAVMSASRALFQGSSLVHRVSPTVQLECFTARLLIVVSRVTQLVNHAVDHLLVTAILVKVFIFIS